MKSKWLRSTLALLLTGTMLLSSAVTVRAEEESGTPSATGKTYYVDSAAGNDANNGTSQSTPFKTLNKVNELNLEPGDQVLLKRGSVFEDQALHFGKEDSGTANAPVIISTYGEGDRPVINTNGQGRWEQNYGHRLDNTNHKWHGTVSSCILIEDTEYIEISGLEMTNMMGDGSKTINGNGQEVDYNDAYAMDRTGVAGVAQDNGTVDHIVLDDLFIHNIKGNVYNKHMCNGGIYFVVEKPANENETGIARYNDVQIKNCHLDTVNRWGIAVGYTYQWEQVNSDTWLAQDKMNMYCSSNVVIENNYLNNVGGDAITTMYLDKPLVQYNVAENIAAQINTTDYCKNQPVLDGSTGEPTGSVQGVGAGRVAAGIWPWKCKDAVFQFNECFKVLNTANGNGDGQPWDADSGDGTLYQYNYSHGNTASTIMFCGGQSVDTTFRYNISVREDMGPMDPAGNNGFAHVYNNTFVIKEGVNSIWYTVRHDNAGPLNCENNIFYFEGENPQTVANWHINNNKVYDNNLYYNVTTVPTNDAHAIIVEADSATSIFAGSIDSAPSATAANGASRFTDGNAGAEFNCLKLAENSPAINTGKVISDLTREKYAASNTRDFFGTALTVTPDIGAAESDVPGDYVVESVKYSFDHTNKQITGLDNNTTVETLLTNILKNQGVTVSVKSGDTVLSQSDIVRGGMKVVVSYGDTEEIYTIGANTDAELKSSYYEVSESESGNVIYIPFTENNPTTVSAVRQNVKGADTATVSVWDGETQLKNNANVAAGNVVRITAEDGTTVTDYTIQQKNTYNWTLEHVPNKQGNVWFGQQKNTSGGEWFNMTTYDPQWPNWQVDTYYGPGIDAQGHSAEITETTHGLLSAPPNTTISTAMAFRVPKTGKISIKVYDSEPYLRQNGNSGGSTVLSLAVNNDAPLQSVELSQSNVKSDAWTVKEIEVQRGDYVRVVAHCTGTPSKPSVHVTPIVTYLDEAAPTDNVAPETPEAVRATRVTRKGATIAWAEALDNVAVTGYKVYYKAEGAADYDYAATTAADAREYKLENVFEEGKTYSVVVTAVDETGNESAQSTAVSFKTASVAELVAVLGAPETEEKYQAAGSYTTASYAPFEAAVDAGVAMTDNVDVTQAEIDAAKKKIEDTRAALVKLGDKTELIKEARTESAVLYGAQDKYTKTSFDAYMAAVGAAMTVLDNDQATEKDVNDALSAILTAKAALVDKSALDTAVKAEADTVKDESKYTAASFKAYKDALNAAKALLDGGNATKEQLESALATLAAAKNALAVKTETPSNNNTNSNQNNSSSNNAGSSNSSNSSNNAQASTGTGAKTGDSANTGIWVAILVVAAVAAGALVVMKRKNNGQKDEQTSEETKAPTDES